MSSAVHSRGNRVSGSGGLMPPGDSVVDNASSSSQLVGKTSRKQQQRGGGEEFDNKYGKRSDQKKQRRLKVSLLLFVFSLSLLGYTIWHVRSKEEGRGAKYINKHKNEIGNNENARHIQQKEPKDDQPDPNETDDSRRMRHQAMQEEEEDGDDGDDDAAERDDNPKLHEQMRRKRMEAERGGRGGGGGGGGGRFRRGLGHGRGHGERVVKTVKKLSHQEFPQYDDDADDEEEEEEERGQGKIKGIDETEDARGEKKENTIEHLEEELIELDKRMESNKNKHIQWIDMRDVPSLDPNSSEAKKRRELVMAGKKGKKNMMRGGSDRQSPKKFFQVHRPKTQKMAWEKEYDAIVDKDPTARADYVDFTKHKYKYPEKLMEPPSRLGDYPKLRTYKELMETWPQDDVDHPPEVLQEDLIHFDFNDPEDMKAALKFRTAKLPFKLINVPELLAANKKWTDEYISWQFDNSKKNPTRSNGKANESPNNFFAFFNAPFWDVKTMGMPPTRDNDWTYKTWAKHAHYADRVGLNPNLPHYYWQSGVPREERLADSSTWSFVSRDLPSFSSNEKNFIVFNPESQKGIQCRFGERGITAANHYDAGRNMIGMISGAKRYILSPPRACPKLGLVTSKGHSSFRHSMLNYGHINYLNRDDMPHEEREWMEAASKAEAISTVVKSGEVLYIPTSWFHYITSLQKSAQCNVRSGVDVEGDAVFGGSAEVNQLCIPSKD
ncbi:MAG: hypothetical protein ACI8RD_007705 [Bacillariaceae sp.]|jgi:hypothetical protein